jgi:hypothetical protein
MLSRYAGADALSDTPAHLRLSERLLLPVAAGWVGAGFLCAQLLDRWLALSPVDALQFARNDAVLADWAQKATTLASQLSAH